jgi:hypothetical protein
MMFQVRKITWIQHVDTLIPFSEPDCESGGGYDTWIPLDFH